MCQCDSCDKHLPKLVRIIYKSAVKKKKSTEVFLRDSAKIKAPSTFINVSIVILMLFCKIKQDNNNYPTTALLMNLYNIHTVFKLGSVIYSNVLKEVSSQQGCIYLYRKNTCLIQEGGLKNVKIFCFV